MPKAGPLLPLKPGADTVEILSLGELANSKIFKT